jgi:stage IV sporulation protein FB
VKLGTWFGVALSAEPGAFLVLALITLQDAQSGPMGLLTGLCWGLLILGSVLVHEAGHALAVSVFGLGPIAVQLHALGGLTRFAKPGSSWQSAVVSVAGPVAGLLLAAVCFVASPVSPFLAGLAIVNVFLNLFNLLPILPLDGGMLLLHVCSLWMDRERATRIAAWTSLLVGGAAAVVAWQLGSIFIALYAGFAVLRAWPLATRGPPR